MPSLKEDGPEPGDVGRVLRDREGLAWVSGLETAFSGEQVQFPGGSGVIRALLRDRVLVEILAAEAPIRPGVEARRTGAAPSIPTGPGLAGRVVSPLGEPLDGLGPLTGPLTRRPHQPLRWASEPLHRPVTPLWTGHPAVDLLYPLGHGMSALIVGEQGSGRGRLLTLAMLALARHRPAPEREARCVYVAVGKTTREVATLRRRLAEGGALAGTTLVLANPGASPPLRCLAPAAGLAIGEAFAEQGLRAVVIVDDLSRGAQAWASRVSALGQAPEMEGLLGGFAEATRALIARAGQRLPARGGGSLSLLLVADGSPAERDHGLVQELERSLDLVIPMARDALGGRPGPALSPGAPMTRLLRRWQPRAMRWAVPAKALLAMDREWRSQGGHLLAAQSAADRDGAVEAARAAAVFGHPDAEPVELGLLLARVILVTDPVLRSRHDDDPERLLGALETRLLEAEPALIRSFSLTGRDDQRAAMERLQAVVRGLVAR